MIDDSDDSVYSKMEDPITWKYVCPHHYLNCFHN